MLRILQIQDLRDDNHFYNSCKIQNSTFVKFDIGF